MRPGRSAARASKGQRQRQPQSQRAQGSRWGKAGFACLVLLIGGVAAAGLVLGPYAWAGEMWRDLAPGWPGEGYGFAVTAGLLLPVAGALVALPLRYINWKQDKPRSAGWAAAALPGIGACVLILSIAMHTIRPKGSSRSGYCHSGGEYCWVSLNYPYVWVVGLGATVLGVVAGGWLYGVYRRRVASGNE
ncbi:hypothetical protein [Streptomyces sp. NPDC047525]|uniref:hypothetical protein n=1 Tax=Streptomyces sp. NPDC047525 TaxID=3155264 RepID=UPI00340EE1E6